jgi:hypothetical protein
MSRVTLARRYGPLLAVLAVQLLIIAVVPSNVPRTSAVGTDSGSGQFGTGPDGTIVDPVTGQVIDPATGQVIGTSGGSNSSSVSSGGGGGGGGGDSGGGSTSHCVSGRQYDPAVYAFAPACAPKFSGSNGGKTAIGVDEKTIKVIVMRGNYGTVVNGALTASGALPSAAEFKAFLDAAVSFINARYELYGRRIVAEPYQIQHGTGGQGKPDDQGLREEMKTMVQNERPFAVIWNTPVSSETFDELSDLGVLNLGGFGFTDTFSQQHAPYHWDVHMGGTQHVQLVAEWWCKRMYGNGQVKAAYAGMHGSDNLATHNRTLGVIATNDPENVKTTQQLDQEIKGRCGAAASYGPRVFNYDQDVTTAETQRQAAVSKMIDTNPKATSVMCFCDQVAPFFLYDQAEAEDYYPENIMVAAGYTDLDSTVQTYDHQLSPERAADEYPQMENAFGLGQFGKQRARDKDDSGKVWQATGRSGTPYAQSTAQNDWEYYAMLAHLIQAAGPSLTATNIMQNVQKAPPLTAGGLTDQYSQGQRSFGPGDFTWNDSMREIYWSPKGASEYGGPGTWRSLNSGKWFRRGELPNAAITLPPKPRA